MFDEMNIFQFIMYINRMNVYMKKCPKRRLLFTHNLSTSTV